MRLNGWVEANINKLMREWIYCRATHFAAEQSAHGIYEISFSFSPSAVGESLELSNYADPSYVNEFTHFHLHFLNFKSVGVSTSLVCHWFVDRTPVARRQSHINQCHMKRSAHSKQLLKHSIAHAPLVTIYSFIFYAHLRSSVESLQASHCIWRRKS